MGTAVPASPATPARWALWLVFAAVLLSRLLFVPNTLEDIDSTNFARALVEFDPARHQPHPPGYPVYVAVAKVVRALLPEPARALGTLSALAQAALVLALPTLFRGLGASPGGVVTGTLLTLFCPALWFNGARPMSDSVGLLFIVVTQALLLRALAAPAGLPLASLLVGLSPGTRLQAAFLTVPLWLFAFARARGRRLVSLLALAGGAALWALPLVALSGGLERYLAAFGDTLGQAAAFEPLLSGFTLNRAARALRLVLLGPWVEPALGAVVVALAGVGFAAAAARRPAALGLALLAFAPYLTVHLLLQDAMTVRYALPYVPFFAFLAAESLDAAAAWRPGRWAWLARRAAPAAIALWSAALTLPALRGYATGPTPPYAALAEVKRRAQPPDRFALGAHFVFQPYLDDVDPRLERLLSPRPGAALTRLREYWLGGGTKPVLFLSEPRRTDLESIDPRARGSLGRWGWPFADERFLSGARPASAELWRIAPPGFFASDGFLLSLEGGKPSEVAQLAERRAYLRALDEPAFLIVAGEPIGPSAQHTLELRLEGQRLFEYGCGEPLLRGLLLPASGASGRYLELLARVRRGERPEGAPFVLRGLDYAAEDATGFAHGSGWFYPETDERRQPFRWTSVRARTLVHVPPQGARLSVLGTAPLQYVGSGGRLELSVDGEKVYSRQLTQPEFRMQATLTPGAGGFREILIESERVFVPDRVQRNGDRRRLGVRVYDFRLESR